MRVSAISKQFDSGNLALQGVDLTLEDGEILGLVGPNGSGKSTLLGIMAGLVDPTGGTLFLRDQVVDAGNSASFRREVGLASQDLALDPELTATEIMTLFARLFGIDPKLRADRIGRALLSLSIDSFSDRRIAKLSGGQRQRIHLGLLLLQQPSVMLLDEPTRALDRKIRDQLWQQLQHFRRQGRTTVIATHELSECEKLFDRIAFMSKGKLVFVDSPTNLIEQYESLSAAYAKLCGEPLSPQGNFNAGDRPRRGRNA